jgi:hypothetical protein
MSNEYNYNLLGIIPEIYFTILTYRYVNINLSFLKITNVLPEFSVTKSFERIEGL